MSVINFWHGAMTDKSFAVVARITDATTAELKVGTSNPPTTLTFTANVIEGVARFAVTGLIPDTTYFYGISDDSVLDEGNISETKTYPPAGLPASFSFAASSCAGHYNDTKKIDGGTAFWPPDKGMTAVSNSPVFEYIRASNPSLFIHMGDLHYRDITENSPVPYRQAFDDVLSAPYQAALYRDVPLAYVWDDHDYGSNDSSSTNPAKESAAKVYRERVPHYPLSKTNSIGVWQSWAIGRVRFIMTDNRSQSTPSSTPEGEDKWYLGPEQEAWLKAEMLAAKEPLIVLAFPSPWHANDNYTTERLRLGKFIDDNGFSERMIIISGDWHGMGMDSGVNNKFGNCPVIQVSPLDSAPSSTDFAEKFNHGTNRARGQWGLFEIEDDGTSILLRITGYIYGKSRMTFSKRFFSTWKLKSAKTIVGSGLEIKAPQIAYKGTVYPIKSVEVPSNYDRYSY